MSSTDHESYEQLRQKLAAAQLADRPGSQFRHNKSGVIYVVGGYAILESTDEVTVIYHAVDKPDVSFVRPLASWTEAVVIDGQTVSRFEKLT